MSKENSFRDDLLTLAEKSAYRETGRTDEVERLCQAYARAWPDAVHSFEYGRSAEGRPMRACIVTRAGTFAPPEIRRRGLPVLMLQAGIHPGESDGKDAGFIALRELLMDEMRLDVLERLVVLFVPAFNTDGHERVGRWNRPNQNGPEQTGWRTTAHNLNLNRDYMKADSPEMAAMLRLLDEWDPLICADLHVTDGADFEHDVSIQAEPIYQGDPDLHASGTQLRDELIAKLAARGSLPLPFYPDLAKTDNPASGFQLTISSPRFSTGYFPTRNRFTVLVETHAWKDYATRIRVTRNAIVGLIELTDAHGVRWHDEVRRADSAAARWGGNEVALDYAASWHEPTAGAPRNQVADDSAVATIEFRGYQYKRSPSPISGALATEYDPTSPQIWRVPFRKNTAPSFTAIAPLGGYVVPTAYAEELARKLTLHGIQHESLGAAATMLDVLVFRADHAVFSKGPFEGRLRVMLQGSWRAETVEITAASIFVPIKQARARLLMALLEPMAQDSLAAWGFFNACFEQKEHLEPYVAERIAREMLATDSNIAAEFERELDSIPEFANSSAARLEFFHRRHPSWDRRFNLYPIYRLER